jgi:RNA polymerase sigma factor (sigma-70 family)
MSGPGPSWLGRRGHRDSHALNTPPLGEHFFRHEYGRLVAMLSCRLGMRYLEAIEDAVQCALLSAVESWTRGRLPDNPPAWLFRVAHNHVLGELRQQARRDRLVAQHGLEDDVMADEPPVVLAGDLRDDVLRMLFVCCDDTISVESQLAIALKTLCGFDVREIAERLFVTEANIYKRLARARSRLRELPFEPDDLSMDQLASRLPAVQAILYVLFTEGYLSSQAETAIRRELCDEAKRLGVILAEHPAGATPETFALLALMHLHTARMTARQNASGGLLLLEEQNRALWDEGEIQMGLSWLARSAQGDVFSRYHAEAGIAAEHCLAPSFEATRWDRIVECYAQLERLAPSPLHTLNRAVAVAEWRGPVEGLAVLEGLEPPSWLAGSYLWAAVLADLHRRCGHDEVAERYRDAALNSAPSSALRDVLKRRLRASPV